MFGKDFDRSSPVPFAIRVIPVALATLPMASTVILLSPVSNASVRYIEMESGLPR